MATVLKGLGYESISRSFFVVRDVYAPYPSGNEILGYFLSFFHTYGQVLYMKFDPNSLQFDQSLEERKEMYKLIPAYCLPTGIVADSTNSPDSVRFVEQLLTAGQRQHIFFSLRRNVNDMNCGVTIPGTLVASPEAVSIHAAPDWLRTQGIAPDSFLQSATAVADEIGQKNPADVEHKARLDRRRGIVRSNRSENAIRGLLDIRDALREQFGVATVQPNIVSA
jgi:hypothetical protein